MIKIESNVPIPPSGRGARRKYPLFEMSVGDSFFVAGKTGGAINGSIMNAERKTTRRFTRRAEPGGVRVWRIT